MKWVVGSDGMLGSTLVEMLKSRNVPFLSTSRRQVEITQQEDIQKIVAQQNISAIINAAAYTNVESAEVEQKQCFTTNVEGACNLAQAARQLDCPFIHVSTDYVFGSEESSPLKEEDPCIPLNIYGTSKYFSELAIQKIYPKSCIVRTSWLFSEKKDNFVTSILNKLEEISVFQIVHDQWGRPTYCHDLSEALLQLIGTSGIFHFANAGAITWYDFANEIYRIAKKYHSFEEKTFIPISAREYTSTAKRPKYSVLSTEKLEKQTTISPRHWKIALKECINKYYKQLCFVPNRS